MKNIHLSWRGRQLRPTLSLPLLAAITYALAGFAGFFFQINWLWIGCLVLALGTSLAWLLQRLVSSGGLSGVDISEATAGTVPPLAPYFVGRESELQQILSALKANGKVTVEGYGGVGKTQVVAAYIERHRSDYSLIWWIRSRDPQVLASDFGAIALAKSLTKDPSARQVRVRKWLGSHRGWLLIFDDVTGHSEIAKFLPRGPGHVILISRERLEFTEAVVSIGDWNNSDAVAYLNAALGGNRTGLEELGRALHHIPLAQAQAANYIRLSGLSVEQYLELLSRRKAELFSTGRAFNRIDTIATTWSLSVSAANREARGAVNLLRLCSIYSGESIPRELPRAFGLADIRNKFNRQSPLALRFRKGLINDVTYNRWVAALSRHMLLAADDSFIRIHPMIAEVVVQSLSARRLRHFVFFATHSIILLSRQKTSGEESFDETPDWELVLPHILGVGRRVSVIKPPIRALLPVDAKVAWFAWVESAIMLTQVSYRMLIGGDIAGAESVIQTAVELAERSRTPLLPEFWIPEDSGFALARALEVAAVIAHRMGNVQEAERISARGLAIRDIGPVERSGLLMGLMDVLVSEGRPAEAKAVFIKEWQHLDKWLSPEASERAMLLTRAQALDRPSAGQETRPRQSTRRRRQRK